MATTLGTAENPIDVDDAPADICNSRASIDLVVIDVEHENEPTHVHTPETLGARERGVRTKSSNSVSLNLTLSADRPADVGSALGHGSRGQLVQPADRREVSVTGTTRTDEASVKQSVSSTQAVAEREGASSTPRLPQRDVLRTPSAESNVYMAPAVGGKSQHLSNNSASREKAASMRSDPHSASRNVVSTLSLRTPDVLASTSLARRQKNLNTAQVSSTKTSHSPQSLAFTSTSPTAIVGGVQKDFTPSRQESSELPPSMNVPQSTSAKQRLFGTLPSTDQEFSTPLITKQIQQKGESRFTASVQAPPVQPSTEPSPPGSPSATTTPIYASTKLAVQSELHIYAAKVPDNHDDKKASATQWSPVDVEDFGSTYTYLERCLSRHLDDRHQSHATTTWATMRSQRTCHERELRAPRRNQRFPTSLAQPELQVQHVSPFADMSSIQIPFVRNSDEEKIRDISQDVFPTSYKDSVNKSSWTVPPTAYKSAAITVPPFKEYVSLRDTVLADNESKLLATPYFDTSPVKNAEDLLKELPYKYEMRHDENSLLDLRDEQCRFYKNSINSFFAEIGLTWDDVLYWLLASNQTIQRINGGLAGSDRYEKLLLERSDHHTERFWRDEEARKAILFDRELKKWRQFRLLLTEPTTTKLRIAALACAAIFSVCKFSVWYLAQQSEAMQLFSVGKANCASGSSRFTYRGAVCRVCHEHNCFVHGELKQDPESDAESEDQNSQNAEYQVPAHRNDDSDLENLINYKVLSNPYPVPEHVSAEVVPSLSKWRLQDHITKWEYTTPFVPCNHEGTCEDTRCRCYKKCIPCEKTCRCSTSCHRRFPGCTCTSPAISGKRVCEASTCLCSKLNRECDADLCGSCGATEILDPVNRYSLLPDRCSNVSIQRGVPRKTLLGNSQVHGFGLYMGEDIKQDEFIGEYTGETISNEELTRREIIAVYQNTLYSFQLNNKQNIDGTYMGNKTRFMNNADEKLSNCKSKNMFCNTVFRIGFYAKADIKAGTELFFNYNYPKAFMQGFRQPNGKLIAVKQTANSKVKSKPPTMSSGKSRLLTSLARRSGQSSARPAPTKSRAATASKRETQLSGNSSHVSEEPDTDKDTNWLDMNKDASLLVADAAENSDIYNIPIEISDDDGTQSKPSKQHVSVGPRSSVVAVRTQKKDEAQASSRKLKRKRPVLVASDEE